MSALALVTGASGFVGQCLVHELKARGWRVRAALRQARSGAWDEAAIVGDISTAPDWAPALAGVDCVFHLAARVHVMQESAANPLAVFRAANTVATARLAEAAQRANTPRLVYVSSAKVMGEASLPGRPLHDSDAPAPADAYAQSKLEAEAALASAGLAHTVIRPPLVYGAGVGANFARLIALSRSRIPLPLGSVRNQRSLISVGNLCHALITAATHPAALGKRFLVADGAALSTPELLRALAAAQGHRICLLPCPPSWLQLGARALGKQAEAERLLGSLELNTSGIRHALGWTPPLSFAEGIHRCFARVSPALPHA